MKIIRNGIEYELTPAEMRTVYLQMKGKYLREDIEAKAEEMEVTLSEDTIGYIIGMADKCLSNNDSYWESYWMTIEYVINEQAEG